LSAPLVGTGDPEELDALRPVLHRPTARRLHRGVAPTGDPRTARGTPQQCVEIGGSGQPIPVQPSAMLRQSTRRCACNGPSTAVSVPAVAAGSPARGRLSARGSTAPPAPGATAGLQGTCPHGAEQRQPLGATAPVPPQHSSARESPRYLADSHSRYPPLRLGTGPLPPSHASAYPTPPTAACGLPRGPPSPAPASSS
jgi:hypothetical protein